MTRISAISPTPEIANMGIPEFDSSAFPEQANLEIAKKNPVKNQKLNYLILMRKISLLIR